MNEMTPEQALIFVDVLGVDMENVPPDYRLPETVMRTLADEVKRLRGERAEVLRRIDELERAHRRGGFNRHIAMIVTDVRATYDVRGDGLMRTLTEEYDIPVPSPGPITQAVLDEWGGGDRD